MMRPGRVASVVLGLLLPLSGTVARADTCVDCHSQQDEERLLRPVSGFANDVHAARGLGCVSCHGGDPNDEDLSSMDPAKGFRGKPTRAEIATLCTSCHADAAYMKKFNPRPYIFSLDEYHASVHSKREKAGDFKAATCTNCHGVHGIRSHRDPLSSTYATNVPKTCATCHNARYMAGRKILADPYGPYSTSVHGKALLEKGDVSAPACNDCHGNHGAAPPGAADVAAVCGTCHGRESELFAKSAIKKGLDLAGKPGCVTCHGSHDISHPGDELLSKQPPGKCGLCHAPGSKADEHSEQIIARFHGLKAEIAHTESLLSMADLQGLETSYARQALREAEDRVVGARATLHSFNAEQILAVLGEGHELAATSQRTTKQTLEDYRMRRVGMAASVVVIGALIMLLLLKIRRLERPESA